jgi:glutathione S-transferase
VPVLNTQGRIVWDTMAILETLAEHHPAHRWWPSDPAARALARSVSAEMHAGFTDLRSVMPMDLLHDKRMSDIPEAAGRDITRIVEIWRVCRSKFSAGGSFLFGDFGIADAMYAPVVTRLRTYVGDLQPFGDDGVASAYCQTIFAMPEMDEWAAGARAELTARGSAC